MPRFTVRLTAPARNQRGVALFAAIAGMVLLSTMIAALVILARNEGMIAQLNKDEAQAAYAAEAGANWGRRLLQQRLNVDLPAAVAATGRLSTTNGCPICTASCWVTIRATVSGAPAPKPTMTRTGRAG